MIDDPACARSITASSERTRGAVFEVDDDLIASPHAEALRNSAGTQAPARADRFGFRHNPPAPTLPGRAGSVRRSSAAVCSDRHRPAGFDPTVYLPRIPGLPCISCSTAAIGPSNAWSGSRPSRSQRATYRWRIGIASRIKCPCSKPTHHSRRLPAAPARIATDEMRQVAQKCDRVAHQTGPQWNQGVSRHAVVAGRNFRLRPCRRTKVFTQSGAGLRPYPRISATLKDSHASKRMTRPSIDFFKSSRRGTSRSMRHLQ